VDVELPRDRLTVLTGPSGSGKSSLAFDTLYAEGQRRYLETLRGDTRALFDQLRRPDVDVVEGLPPTLCVSQNTGSARPRSTLATMTEIHDHLRLLWARAGTPYCYRCGSPIHRHTLAEVIRGSLALGEGRKLYILAPLVSERKGDQKEVFQQIRQSGFLRARVNGALLEIRDTPRLNPRQSHTIDLVVDRLVLREGIRERLAESLAAAIRHGDGTVIVSDLEQTGDWQDHVYSTRYACPKCGIRYGELEPRSFSFNNPQGACPACEGLGRVWEIDPERVVPDRGWTAAKVLAHLKEQIGDAVKLPAVDQRTLRALASAFPHPEGKAWGAKTPVHDWPAEAFQALLYGTEKTEPPLTGLVPTLRAALAEAENEEADGVFPERLEAFAGYLPCPECGGARLNREARSVRFAGKALHEVTALSVDDATAFFADLTQEAAELPGAARQVRKVLLTEILHRLRFLQEVGLGYLTLDRPAPTLSGGEAQRARLATHLGTGLLGVCYILDEPTIGLHPRDTGRLLGALRALQGRGNTLVVVEHDESVIRAADYLVDMGPGAGRNGGRVLARGTVEEVLRSPESVTAPYLRLGEPGA
jgi:excinuclease ABC subunit A